MAGKTVRVTQESDSGRNQQFHDTEAGANMSRAEFCGENRARRVSELSRAHHKRRQRLLFPIPIGQRGTIWSEACLCAPVGRYMRQMP